ncbi:MAG: hypothetical protein E7443_03975 [Ruminococcaceae bacterium]|nr:hypothetical protein [Oscillospiraceae bacterium]
MDIFNLYKTELSKLIDSIVEVYFAIDGLPASKRNNRFYRELAQAGRKSSAKAGISKVESDALVRCIKQAYNTAQTMPEETRVEYFIREMLDFIISTIDT